MDVWGGGGGEVGMSLGGCVGGWRWGGGCEGGDGEVRVER